LHSMQRSASHRNFILAMVVFLAMRSSHYAVYFST
jgi:hypothetical protein